MKIIRLLVLSFALFVLSVDTQAKPHTFNLDTVYAHADFCDRVEIINYDTTLHLLSVKSRLDSLTYSFYINNLLISNFTNKKTEYLLIRSKSSSHFYNDQQTVIIGILKGKQWVFNETQFWNMESCFIITSNPVAKIKEHASGEEIRFPKKYFQFKTPSASWSEEERTANNLFEKSNFKIIHFDSVENRYFNDTIYIKKTVVDSTHIAFMFNITLTENSTQHSYHYMKTLLASLKMPYEKILENSEKSTSTSCLHDWISSYSNSTYKLILFTFSYGLGAEDFIFLDLHLK